MTHSTLLALLLATPCADELSLAQHLLPLLQKLGDLIHTFRHHELTPAATHDFETQLAQLLRQLGLQVCDWTYNHLEPAHTDDMPPRLDYEGEHYRRRERSPNTLATLFGRMTLHRFLYENREPGNPCLFPLEHRLGVVAATATPALAERASWWLAQQPQGGTLAVLERDHGVVWAPNQLRQVAAAFAAAVAEHRQDSQVKRLLDLLDKAHASVGCGRPQLVVGRDGINVPMRGKQAFREGSTATVSVYDRRGKRVGTVYLGQMPQGGQGTLTAQLTDLIEAVLQGWQGPLPRLVYVTDDGHHPATYYHQVLKVQCHPRTGERLTWQRVVDFYHATLYVQKLAEALFGKTKRASAWYREMRQRLKEKDGVKRVLQAASVYAAQRKRTAEREELYDEAYHYLRKNGRWMKYNEYKKVGMPLGSGVTEAGCKILFTQRLKQSGMRWDEAGGQVVLTLRSVLLSQVWDATVQRFLAAQTFPWPAVECHRAEESLPVAA